MLFAHEKTFPDSRESVEVIFDPDMGRCLRAKTSFRAGDILFKENSFVFASFDGVNKFEQELLKAAFPKCFADLDDILDDLSNLSRVQSLDTAKNFCLLLAITYLRRSNRQKEICRFIEAMGLQSTEVDLCLESLDQLTAANVTQCISELKTFRKLYPKFLRSEISDEDAAHLLGKVTTNQLELEELGGSGLFLTTAIFQHDCLPSCSYTTSDNKLYVAAVRNIQAGERLSIDYGNDFYAATGDRVDSLQETYGFKCTCSLCVGPDTARSFCCEGCRGASETAIGGYFCPIGAEAVMWTPCKLCGVMPTPEHIKACLMQEETVKMSPPGSAVEICAIVAERWLHDSHHLIFHSLDELYMSLSEEAGRARRTSPAKAAEIYSRAVDTLTEVIRLLETKLPPIHHEKVVYYDRLGQLGVASGNSALAKEAFDKAYQHSRLACGEYAPATLAVQRLATHMPNSIEELQAYYRQRGVGDQSCDDGMDEA